MSEHDSVTSRRYKELYDENTALKAHVERLRSAVSLITRPDLHTLFCNKFKNGMKGPELECDCITYPLLSETPAQSLATLRNEIREELKARIKLWIPHIEQLAKDYQHSVGSDEIHPIHKDLIADMKEVSHDEWKR